jgi:hypothetical protein
MFSPLLDQECDRIVLMFRLRLCAALWRRDALDIIDVLIVGYLLEELVNSQSLERSCKVSDGMRKLEVGHRHVPLFLFLGRVLNIDVFSRCE